MSVGNGEWEIKDLHLSSENTTFHCCPNPFSTITITLHVARMPLYYILYIILPMIALTLVYSMIFHLDIGQRASYGVTILLSITVYLLVLSNKLPEKSNDLPYIGICFIVEFFLMVAVLPLAEYSAHIAHRSNHPPPQYLTNMMKYFRSSTRTARISVWFDEDDKTLEMEDAAKYKEAEDLLDYNKQWRRLSQFFDMTLSIMFTTIVVIAPLLVGLLLAT